MTTITFYIDGEWSAHDFVIFFHAVDQIHDSYRFLERRRALTKFEQVENLVQIGDSHEESVRDFLMTVEKNFPNLMVSSISYASPGKALLEGAEGMMRQVRGTISDLLNRDASRRVADAEASLAEERVLQERVKTRMEFVREGKAAGLTNDEINQLWGQISDGKRSISNHIDSGKLIGVDDETTPRQLTKD